jgi:hypothetical protein
MEIPAAQPATDANEWKPRHEAPALLSFTGGRFVIKSQDELSDLLTRKFREFFP